MQVFNQLKSMFSCSLSILVFSLFRLVCFVDWPPLKHVYFLCRGKGTSDEKWVKRLDFMVNLRVLKAVNDWVLKRKGHGK